MSEATSGQGAEDEVRYDNACVESLFSTLKNELTHDQAFATREAARMAIVSYIEGFHSHGRLHQTLGYRMPASVDDEAMRV